MLHFLKYECNRIFFIFVWKNAKNGILNSLLSFFKLEKLNSSNVLLNYKYRGRHKLQEICNFSVDVSQSFYFKIKKAADTVFSLIYFVLNFDDIAEIMIESE